ncbi:hypothetical protein SDC9_01532 [bioreactor metagenome]|uniref:Uncharacterized protein n=1 Tax=bioreactor metagenome TaxID=1076179 RepID=A0A644SMZ9_9ZZZZ
MEKRSWFQKAIIILKQKSPENFGTFLLFYTWNYDETFVS